MSAAVQCKNISKVFKDTKALNNINLTLEENKIYGILGRNGAGKTTLLKTIANQLLPTSGEVYISNKAMSDDDNLMRNICLARDKYRHYFDSYKVKDIFNDARLSFPNWDDEFAKVLADEFKLPLKKRYKRLSDGMKGMVSTIIGLASRAPITIFDETYVGLDAVARQKFYDILREDFIENPRTILFSTHFMDEVAGLFEEVILINEGEVIINEPIESIEEKALYIEGNKEVIDKYIKDKKVISTELLGDYSITGIFDTLDDSTKENMLKDGIKFSRMPLQKWFVHTVTNL